MGRPKKSDEAKLVKRTFCIQPEISKMLNDKGKAAQSWVRDALEKKYSSEFGK